MTVLETTDVIVRCNKCGRTDHEKDVFINYRLRAEYKHYGKGIEPRGEIDLCEECEDKFLKWLQNK